MIDVALDGILDELNAYLAARFGTRGEDAAVLSGLNAANGGLDAAAQNKVVLSLASVEREHAAPTPSVHRSGDDYVRTQPPLNLNLYLVVAAHASDYRDGLKRLSRAIGFFQARPTFTPETAPSLPPEIRKLTFEMVDLDLQQTSHLWSTLGHAYLPSVVYKVRMLTFQEGWTEERVPAVGDSSPTVES